MTLLLIVAMSALPATPPPRAAPPAAMLMADYCVACHSERGKAGGLSLAGFDPAKPEANVEVSEKVIRKLRAGMMPPPGMPRPEAATMRAFVESLETAIDTAAAAHPRNEWRPFQRLNRGEYATAVRDLLGIEIDASKYLPADTLSNGYDNIADVQRFSPTLIAGYLRGAAEISRRATLPDTPATVARLVKQAYRGSATPADVEAAMGFYRRGGVRLAVQSILVSPRFLFRLETSLASRLSYFLWDAGPDADLLRADLSTAAEREKQMRRLLANKRSEALTTRFASQWLRLQDLDKVSDFDRALAKSMRKETELFIESLIRDDRSVLDLFTADYTFVDARLARHYGMSGVTGDGFRKVASEDMRRGLLGQGSILVSTSLADRTSPVLRGKWVMEVLFGMPPPPPPPNVPALDDTAAPIRDGKPLSTRQRMEQHRKSPACAGCHRGIDPPGLALENFSASGAWRTSDNDVAVDASGELYDGSKIDGPAGLRQAILNHQDIVLRNFTENLLTYALGRRITSADMPAVRAIVNQAAKDGNRFSAFIRGVVNSAAFLAPAGG